MLQLREVGQTRIMSECVVIIRDGDLVKACYRVDAPGTQVTLLKEMIKAGVYVKGIYLLTQVRFDSNYVTLN